MNTPSQAQVRRAIAEAQTIVVKVGSSSLTEPSGHLDPQRLNALVAAIARVRLMGGRVVLVSSGAIAAGFGTLGFDKRPTDVADQQACAAVGQGLLMAQYEAAFARYGLRVGQILITVSDTIAPQQYRNVRRTLDRLLDLGAVPIINENDSLASNEIRFGDNDRLSALIANIVVADALVLLTDVDALYTAPPSEPGSKRISYVPNVEDALAKVQVGGTGSNVGTGGMVTKLEAARVAAKRGYDVLDKIRALDFIRDCPMRTSCKARVIPYRTKKGYSKPTQNRTALPICAGTPTTVFPARTSSGPDFKPCLRTLKPGKWVRSSSRT